MKLLLNIILTLSVCGFLQTAFAQHGHINAGAQDTNGSGGINAGDKLKMYFEPDTVTTVMTYNAGSTVYGVDGYNWNGYTTLTSLHQSTYISEAPDYNSVGALSGSNLVLNLTSITGTLGAKFAFYETGSINPTWVYQVGTGFLNSGTGTIQLTDSAWFASDPSDPFGHIHGRMFALDMVGEYTATWFLQDTESATTGLLNSDSFTMNYSVESVPEPSTYALLLLSGVMLIVFRKRFARV
ncbi:MAG: PEP-CTERM sorting domain-containing protein [Chthoniobacterales bacterium]